MEWRMLRLLNKDRKRHGLKPLRMQEDLRFVARKHSKDMAEKDYFDHVNFKAQSHVDRLKTHGVSDVVSGENLAKIGGYRNPTQTAEIGLMNSPGHRANILNGAYNTVGIGVIKSAQKVYYFTQNFAKRDLIFTKSIPFSFRIHKKLKITGYAFTCLRKILYQIKDGLTQKIVEEKVLELSNHIFEGTIIFKTPGSYEISFYICKDESHSFTLTNEFKVKVTRGWLFL